MIEAGNFYNAKVKRRTDIGYMLDIDGSELFLHQNQANHDLEANEEIKVFAYFDNKKRLSTTMETALITTKNAGWVKVNGVVSKLGVFINININKDILLATDYLPYDEDNWPIVGDEIFCILKAKPDRLNAKIVNNVEVLDFIKTSEKLEIGQEVVAVATRVTKEGIGFFTKNLSYVFVYKTMMRKKYRVGEEVMVNIIHINESGYNGSFIKNKEFMIDDDTKVIVDYLKNHKGIMPYGNNTDPDVIYKLFNMSKKAFKRTIGSLYKERIIEFDEDKNTVLIKK